jgi:hypothetical protein
MNRTRPTLAAALAALAMLLAGCSGADDKPAKATAAAPAPTAAATQKTAAAPRPEDQLPPPACASKAGADLPGPDIVGLKLGMPFAAALNRARCAVKDGTVGFSQRWFQQMRTGSVQLHKQGFTIQRGDTSDCDYRKIGDAQKCGLGRRVWDHVDELISVASPGLDGRQAVFGIWRHQHWKPGEMPSRDAVLAALRDKYGKEGELTDQQHGTMSWRYDLAGMPLKATDALFRQCYGPAARAGSSQRWSEGCGYTITADLVPPRDNPQLVQALYVGLMHQEQLLKHGDAMQAELDRLDAARRAQEVEKAAGSAPKL